VREYLDALEELNGPAYTPQLVSLSDPAATLTGATGDRPFFAYSTNYLIDLKAGIIVDVKASAVNKTDEVEATSAMIERVEDKFGMKPDRLVGDTNYGSAAMLNWLVDEKRIEPHVPVWDKSERNDGTFSRSAFQWEEVANEYRCPEGHALRNDWQAGRPPNRVTKDNTVIYRSRKSVCEACPQKDRCCRTPRLAKSPGASMKRRGMLPVAFRLRQGMNDRGGSARKSKCSSPTS
jgi:Transposase DDE domain